MVENANLQIDATRDYLLYEMKNNDLMSEKQKYINYVENLLILSSTITGCVSISSFASLVCIPVGITSSAIEIKNCAINAGIQTYKSIIKKKKKTHD